MSTTVSGGARTGEHTQRVVAVVEAPVGGLHDPRVGVGEVALGLVVGAGLPGRLGGVLSGIGGALRGPLSFALLAGRFRRWRVVLAKCSDTASPHRISPARESRDRGRRSRRSRRPALTAGLLAVVAMVVLPCFPAGAVETPRLGIRPAHEANYFHLALLPGGQTTNAVVVSNYSDRTSRIRVYAVDADITPQGQFALRDEKDPRQTVGNWLVPSVSELTLAPRSSAQVEFGLVVPPGTAPQDYAGGIVLEGEPHAQPAQSVGGETAVQLNVVERLGVRVYLKVGGNAREHLVAGPLTWGRVSGGAIDFSLALRNDGNVRLAPTGVVNLTGLGLSGQLVTLSRPESLLPGATTTVRGRWNKPPLYVLGHAKAVIKYGNGQITDASTGVRLIPVMLTTLLALLAVAFLYLAYRLIRFVRTARVALRTFEHVVPDATGMNLLPQRAGKTRQGNALTPGKRSDGC